MQSTAAGHTPSAQGLALAVFREDAIGHKYKAPDLKANPKPPHQKKLKTGQKPSDIIYDIMMAKYQKITVDECDNGEE